MSHDLTQPGTPIDVEKMRTLQVKGSAPRRVAEGSDADGRFKKTVVDDGNAIITERTTGKAGTAPGVSDRQDVEIFPKTVHQSMSLNGS